MIIEPPGPAAGVPSDGADERQSAEMAALQQVFPLTYEALEKLQVAVDDFIASRRNLQLASMRVARGTNEGEQP